MNQQALAREGRQVISPATIAPLDWSQINRAVLAHRIVQIGMLITLVWKWSFFVFANSVYNTIALQDPFFPAWLRSAFVLRLVFLGAVATIVMNVLTSKSEIQRWCSWVTMISVTVMCLHQGSYNDMTFVTAWWTSLWALWFVHRMEQDEQTELIRKAAFLSRLMISVILLGGGLGKWTAEYWSGEVFYDIYFRDRDFWVFNLLRAWFEPETLQTLSMWYSRQVVVIETVAGMTLWLLPARWAAAIAILILTSIALLSNILLFSVLTCLIGLAAVGFFVPRRETNSIP
jgi:hypothetical protein